MDDQFKIFAGIISDKSDIQPKSSTSWKLKIPSNLQANWNIKFPQSAETIPKMSFKLYVSKWDTTNQNLNKNQKFYCLANFN